MVTRKAVYRILKEALTEGKRGDPSETVVRSVHPSNLLPLSEDSPGIDWDRLKWFASQVVNEAKLLGDYWERLVRWVEDYYPKNIVRIWRTLCARTRSAKRRKRRAFKKSVCFDCSSLYGQRAEALAGIEFRTNCDQDVSNYVNVISALNMEIVPHLKTDLVELLDNEHSIAVAMNSAEVGREFLPVVGDGRRVVCTVGRFEASSSGYIDHLPNAPRYGATLSLVDSAVLTRLGKTSYPLHPYEGRVSSSSGHALLVEGWTHLPIQLGSVELTLKVLVVDKLHIDVILGVDALGASGVEAVESTYLSTMASSVRLPPLGQALVLTNLIGETPDGATVLVEGVMNLPPALGVARSLSTINNGQVVMEICNVSTEEYWVRKGTTIAAGSVVPGSAFNFESRAPLIQEAGGLSSVATTTEGKLALKTNEDRPERPTDLDPTMSVKADFTSSSLSEEQNELFQAELDRFGNMFVESSKKLGRTDLLKFEIDPGNSPPFNSQPYRVSEAEGEVMESEIQQHLDLGFIRESRSPWASPVLMIRKPDGGIRFCIG
ncbi:LOW QUALITY PROTEIN: hypothetical protein PHMEG_000515 [Phytophthora megakarya]|uniref:Reverse transcriptase n=1 Tax=Phytophthora megakarya TaxID=4795 RepID=A0A225X2W1_9STRA|nr:LOW QUALITY PROTEIN: hypothetical protein PHMEG_000515 [Phytophthora megakarya]